MEDAERLQALLYFILFMGLFMGGLIGLLRLKDMIRRRVRHQKAKARLHELMPRRKLIRHAAAVMKEKQHLNLWGAEVEPDRFQMLTDPDCWLARIPRYIIPSICFSGKHFGLEAKEMGIAWGLLREKRDFRGNPGRLEGTMSGDVVCLPYCVQPPPKAEAA